MEQADFSPSLTLSPVWHLKWQMHWEVIYLGELQCLVPFAR